MLIGLGCLIVIIGIGTGLTSGKFPSSASGSKAAPASAGAAASAHSRAAATLTYRVTGTAGATVTYGPVGRTVTSQGPLHVTTTLGSALYYSITAQLQGSGSATCEILIGSTLISQSVATGRHSVASCGISQNPLSGKWQDAGGG
jgi:hypothetical protein